MQAAGQAALVTGGASGLGAQTVRELVALGARVAILDANIDAARALAEETGALALHCDICDSASGEGALRAAARAHGRARILVTGAGIGGARRLGGGDGSAMPLEDFSRIIQV